MKQKNSVDLAKIERKKRIIDAAEFLIKTSGTTSFSMHVLAKAAELSTNTTYNLIGSKATVLYVLLNRSVDKIDAARAIGKNKDDPINCLINAGDAAVDAFIGEPEFYKPLLKYLFSAEEPAQRSEFMDRSFSYWMRAIAPLSESGKFLGTGLHAIDLVRDVLIFFTGVTEFWVHDDLTSDEFRAQVRHGISLRLICIANSEERTQLVRNIAIVRPTMHALSNQAERSLKDF